MIPVMNLSRQYKILKEELDQSVVDVLSSGEFILGKRVRKFEEEFAEYCGTKYAVGVGNGTDALVIALKACGVKAGDEVITSAMSFIATAEAIVSVGAIPVFVDCTLDTYTIDANQIEQKITNRTKAIIPVHLYGQCADMGAIGEIAKRYKLKVVEDAAQAAGALYKGHRAGSLADIGCFSFFPTKNLGCAGDGGIIVTSSEELYKYCLALRVHGSGENGYYVYRMSHKMENEEYEINFKTNQPKYYNYISGFNSRLDEIQAAILSVKLPYIEEWNLKRRKYAEEYDKNILNKKFKKPFCKKENESVYYVYIIMTEDRDSLRSYLRANGIDSGVYFPLPLHLQKVFESLGYRNGDMPNAEYLAKHNVAIPMFPELTQKEREKIIDVLNHF